MKRRTITWRALAEKLAAAIPPTRLHPAVRTWAETRPAREKWGVAFSGGADSLALLLLLWAHWPARRGRLVVLHFDHRLRGAESRADAAFCRQVSAALGLTLVRGSWTAAGRRSRARAMNEVGSIAGAIASEAAAREARMTFFAEHARVVWFGHQQDDIAETMLMRLARGSGAGGLAAPRPVQFMPAKRVHLRPLLTLKKAEIVAALQEVGAPWREDSSNARGDYFRNRIRHEVLGAWNAAAGRDALAGAARARELLEEDDAALEAWVDALAPVTSHRELSLARLSGLPRAVLRRALHRWLRLESRAGELSRQAFDALLTAIERGRPTRHSLGREGFAVIAADRLRFEKAGKSRRKIERRTN